MMSKKILVVLFFILCMFSANAKESLQDRVVSFTGTAENTVIVFGKYSSPAERLTIMMLKDIYPDITTATIIEEDDFDPNKYKNHAVVLIGGPEQNNIAEQVLNTAGAYTIEDFPAGKVVFIKNYMVFSDPAGFNNFARTSQYNSPLAKYMPVALVPIAATAVSFSLVWLWSLLQKIFQNISENFLANRILKKVEKKKLSLEFKGFHLKGIRVKYREWISIAISATIFSAAITYTYFTSSNVLWLVMTNLIVNLSIYFFQNSLRLIFDNHHQSHTEYNLWYFGIFLTLLSGWLGNTFGLAGYVSADESHEKAKTKIQFKTIIITSFLGVLFFMLNFNHPTKLLQLITVSLVTTAFLQLLPIAPFSGKEIRKWNTALWFITFLPMLLFYIVINLVY